MFGKEIIRVIIFFNVRDIMKLLVSDYDGTLNSNYKNLCLNIRAINKFRENGNKFVIATGRSFESIKKETDIYGIEYDYLICNGGLITFDDGNNILNHSLLNNDTLINLYGSLTNLCCVEKIKLYNFYSSTINMENILEIYVKFNTTDDALWYKKYIEYMIPGILCYQEANRLYIGNKITKADAISFIQAKDSINKENIYTVGDNKNDLEMLEQYKGYRMLFSNSSLWGKKIPVTREVHTLIKKINKR